MTKVINLFGGSGLGKSTTAAGLFYELKTQHKNVELITEYVKRWAWIGKEVGPYDQLYLFAKQARSEYELYGKVDYLITDSPTLLAPIYEEFKEGESIVEQCAFKHMTKAEKNGVEYLNFLLERNSQFSSEGRYEDLDLAVKIDKYVEKFLIRHNVSFIKVSVADSERVKFILDYIDDTI